MNASSSARQVTYRARCCSRCGKSFSPSSSASKHCSPECRFLGIADKFSGDACWEWPLSRNKQSGYGQFTLNPAPRQVLVTAHRLSYALFVGPIGQDQCVMHKCDNRGCFNPGHLLSGSIGDNNRDMYAKGRAAQSDPAKSRELMCKAWATRRGQTTSRNRATP